MRPVEIDLTLRSRRHLKHCIMNATQITTAIIEITMTTITRVFDESGTCSVVISTEIEKKPNQNTKFDICYRENNLFK